MIMKYLGWHIPIQPKKAFSETCQLNDVYIGHVYLFKPVLGFGFGGE